MIVIICVSKPIVGWDERFSFCPKYWILNRCLFIHLVINTVVILKTLLEMNETNWFNQTTTIVLQLMGENSILTFLYACEKVLIK